jgi:hypothetical protein
LSFLDSICELTLQVSHASKLNLILCLAQT